jgi:formylglycine-generating enzyme required for sulfatase activity
MSLRAVIVGLCFLVGCTHRPVGTGDSYNNADMLVDAPSLDSWLVDAQVGEAGQLIPSWVAITAGSFVMGSPTSEPCREHYGGRETQRKVTLTRGFQIQNTEVTLGQFRNLMGYQPPIYSHLPQCGHDRCPVDFVSWHEAAAYCNGLSAQHGFTKCYACTGNGSQVTCNEPAAFSKQNIYQCPGYRLPTEAEWEYAYRAGSTTAFYNGPNDPNGCFKHPVCKHKDANAEKIAWHCLPNSSVRVVGQKQKNSWGLFDMAGNAAEWCHDKWQYDRGSSSVIDPWGALSGIERVVRGGSIYYRSFFVRAAHRPGADQTYRGPTLGFRCVRTLVP